MLVVRSLLYVFRQLESTSANNYKLLSFCVLFHYNITISVTKREPIIEWEKTQFFLHSDDDHRGE